MSDTSGLPAAAASGAIDEITVSATRRDRDSSQVSAAVAIVDGDTVRASQLLTDALRDTPGVFVQQTTPGQGAAIIRGLKGSSLLHMIDGMRINNAIFRSAPTQYFALVPTMAVSRVEVLRGTPTSLYGSDAVGGVVQVVSHVPIFDQDETESRYDLSAYLDSAELTRSVRARVDTGNRKLATSFSLEFADVGDRQTGSGGRTGPSDYRSIGGRFAVSANPDEQSNWYLDIQFVEQPETPRVDELVPGFGQSEPSSSEYTFEPNRRAFAHLRYTRNEGPLGLDWRLGLSHQRIDDDRVTRNFNADNRRFEENRSDLTGFLATAGRSDDDRSWIAGVEYYHDDVSSSRENEDIVSGVRQPVTGRFPDGSTVDQLAAFFNADVQFDNGHGLSGGLRLSRIEVDVSETPVSGSASIDSTDLSGDVGWRYEVTPDWQIVANAGFGFRAPNVFDLGTLGTRPGNRFNIPNTTHESEQVVQIDSGLRYLAAQARFELMLFALWYDDRITSVPTGQLTPSGREIVQSANASESRVHGVELSLGLALGDSASLDAVVSYAHGRQEFAGQTEPGDRIPPLSGRLTINYEPSDSLGVSAWIKAADSQDRLSARDIGDVRIDPNGTAGWMSAGMELDWLPRDGWQLGVGVDNVFDKAYRYHGSGIDAPGRNVFLNIRRQW